MRSQLQEARANKVLNTRIDYAGIGVLTRREFITHMIEDGGRVEIMQVEDTATHANLQREHDLLARTCPFGNPNYPSTKRYLELREILKQPITKPHYYLHVSDRSGYSITKTEYDFALTVTVVPRPAVDESEPQHGYGCTCVDGCVCHNLPPYAQCEDCDYCTPREEPIR